MERIRGQITTPVLIGAGVGAVLGLIIGLIIAWGIWPVQWTNGPLSGTSPEVQRDYLVMAVQNFAQTQDAATARTRWAQLGDDKQKLLNDISAKPPAGLNPQAVSTFAAAVGAGAPAGGQPGTVTTPGAPQATAAAPKPATSGPMISVVIGLCLVTLVIGGLAAYLLFFRKPGPSMGTAGRPTTPIANRVTEPTTYTEGQEPPIVQYLTTYNVGNDLYDDSFSIDSPTGEFLGECGVGISETIGVGDPKKVTAFEVWLFDKNDIQTVTKVVMSQHAFNDPSINQRLASKGEPVQAEPGKRILLETATLQLEARVVNMAYGSGALPANSYFDQMTLELAVWQKKA